MTQSKIIKAIRKLGYNVIVLNASFRNRYGIPDCLISIEGKAMFIEIKIDDDKLSKMQKEFISEFHQCSFVLHYDTSYKMYSFQWRGGFYDDELLNAFIELKNKLNEGVKR